MRALLSVYCVLCSCGQLLHMLYTLLLDVDLVGIEFTVTVLGRGGGVFKNTGWCAALMSRLKVGSGPNMGATHVVLRGLRVL